MSKLGVPITITANTPRDALTQASAYLQSVATGKRSQARTAHSKRTAALLNDVADRSKTVCTMSRLRYANFLLRQSIMQTHGIGTMIILLSGMFAIIGIFMFIAIFTAYPKRYAHESVSNVAAQMIICGIASFACFYTAWKIFE